METLQKLFLYIHIAAGFTALTVGIVPMIARKGSRLHVSTGRIFVWAMYLVAATAVLIFFLKPYRPFLLYLAFIGVFSFYLTYSGVRSVQGKADFQATVGDWLAAGIALRAGLVMLGLSLWNFTNSQTFLGILYAVFGGFITVIAFRDVQKFRKKVTSDKMAWFFLHISRIVGAYIATFTAFCVVNADRVAFIHPLVVWVAPGLIGGIGIARWITYHRRKMKLV